MARPDSRLEKGWQACGGIREVLRYVLLPWKSIKRAEKVEEGLRHLLNFTSHPSSPFSIPWLCLRLKHPVNPFSPKRRRRRASKEENFLIFLRAPHLSSSASPRLHVGWFMVKRRTIRNYHENSHKINRLVFDSETKQNKNKKKNSWERKSNRTTQAIYQLYMLRRFELWAACCLAFVCLCVPIIERKLSLLVAFFFWRRNTLIWS